MRKFVIGLLAFIGFLTLSGCQKTASPTYLKTPYTKMNLSWAPLVL